MDTPDACLSFGRARRGGKAVHDGGHSREISPILRGLKTPGKRHLKAISWIKSFAPQLCRPIPVSRCARESRIPGSSRMIPAYPGLKLGSCLAERVLGELGMTQTPVPSAVCEFDQEF